MGIGLRKSNIWILSVCGFFAGAVLLSGGEKEQVQEKVKQLEKEYKNQEKNSLAARKKLAEARKKLNELKKKGSVDINSTQFCIPRMKKAPVIDGIVDEKEWEGAMGVPLTTGIYGMFERPSSMFYVGWDPEYLYFGQRLPMREGELPLRLNREPKHDNVYCGETSLEVYVDRKSHGSHGSGCRWQFMGNAVGNRWEREDQYEIGQNFIGWDADWLYKQRLTPDGKFWEAEIAIPRKAVYQKDPIKENDLWWIGMATNLHRPWCFSGFYGWRVPATFKDSVPEIRMNRPDRSLAAHGIVFDMSINNNTDKDFKGELITRLIDPKQKDPKKKIVFEKIHPVNLAAGKKEIFKVNEKIDEAKDQIGYKMAVIVKQGDNSLYTWSYPIRYNHPDSKQGLAYTPDKKLFPLFAYYNPMSNYLRVRVDKYDVKDADKVVKASFTITPEGGDKVIAKGEIDKFNYGNGETNVPTPADIAPGKYTCKADLLDKAGKVLVSEKVTFVRKDHQAEIPWLNNKIGEEDIVVKPFEGLKVDGDVINAYEKQITLNGCALPEKVEAVGVSLLRAPIAFEGVSAGQNFTVKPVEHGGFLGIGENKNADLVDDSATHADYRGQGAGGPIKVSTEAHWEYDSTCKVKVKLEATGEKAKLDKLQLVIPFSKDGATHFMANGLNMRLSNIAGLLPKKGDKNGVLWKSQDMPYQKMTVGSFVPIVWLGNLKSGLTWFADSDKGWWPNNKVSAAEIVRRKDGNVDLVLNIASEPVEFSGTRELSFGLNVNPVRKPTPHIGSRQVFGWLPQTGRWDPEKTKDRSVFARRYPENVELNKKYIDLTHKYGAIYAPYTEMSYQDFFPEDVKYFKEEWDIGGAVGGSPFFDKSSNDALLYMTKKWIEDCGLDGYYFDNIFNRLNWNTHYGTAYKLPDGRIQPGYNLWGMRNQIKRIRTLLQVEGRDPSRICIHNTRYQFAPIMGFADLAMGGEMATPSANNPGAGDFMDMYPRDFMDVMYNQPLWGYKLSHLYHFRSNTYKNDLEEYDRDTAMKIHRSAMATMLVHGVEFFQGIDYKGFLKGKFQMLNKLPGGKLEFIPSWKADGLFKVEGKDKDIDVAVYKKQDVLLIIFANYSKHVKTARAWFDFPKLIRMPQKGESRVVWDFEDFEFAGYIAEKGIPKEEKMPRIGDLQVGQPLMHQDNILRVRVQPHDFRAILIMNLPICGSGAGF